MSLLRPMFAVLLASVCSSPGLIAAESPRYLDHNGYRASMLRAPTPPSAPGAVTLTTAQLSALLSRASEGSGEQPVLVDVQAVAVRPEHAEFGLAWLAATSRWHIPDSVWLPNVGFAELSPEIARYFETELARITRGNRQRPLVFYCIADCWLSWNAVQRASRLGYDNLYWYPEGTDGWREQGLPLQQAIPVPIVTYAGPALAADAASGAP